MNKCKIIFLIKLFINLNCIGQEVVLYPDSMLDSIINTKSINNKKIKSIKEIAIALKINDSTSFLQYQVLAKWVVNNLNYADKATNNKSLMQAIKTGEAVCYHYSMIFDSLCKYLDIDSHYIAGSVKSFTSNGNLNFVGHAWNSVKIGGKIYMTDLTWSDGNNEKKSNNASLGTVYFLISPKNLILSHFPYQRKNKHINYSYHKFKKSSIVERGFFTIDYFFNHNIDLIKFGRKNQLDIKLDVKENKEDSIKVIGFDLLPCSNCKEFTEVIKFEEQNNEYLLDKSKVTSIVKNTPVYLILTYEKNGKEFIKPVLEFLW